MRSGAVSILTAAVLLAACGSTTSDTTPAPPARSADRPSVEQIAAFTEAFTAKYPDLAEGRSESSIGYDADNTCLNLRRDKPSNAAVIKQVQARFEYEGQPLSAKQAGRILALIKSKACPDA